MNSILQSRVFYLAITSFFLCSLVVSAGCQTPANGQNNVGTNLYQQGQYHAALQRFQQALAYDPLNSDAYYNLAATYHRLGKINSDDDSMTQAEQLYNRCLDLSPEHADCHRGLAVLLAETERSEKAFTLLERWAARSPHSADAHIELARLYEEYGDKESARTQLEQALAADSESPASSRAWAALASLREEAGDYEQALANYQRSYQLNTLQPGVEQRIASLRSNLSGTPAGLSSPGGTRVVASPSTTARY